MKWKLAVQSLRLPFQKNRLIDLYLAQSHAPLKIIQKKKVN